MVLAKTMTAAVMMPTTMVVPLRSVETSAMVGCSPMGNGSIGALSEMLMMLGDCRTFEDAGAVVEQG